MRSSEANGLRQSIASAAMGQNINLSVYDETDLLQSVVQHGIGPLLACRIHKEIDFGLTEKSREQLDAMLKQQVAHDLLLNDSTIKTIKLLAANEIPALLLKGTPIAHLYYEASYQRYRCDTDLYISPQNTEKAARVLSDNSYTVSGYGSREHSSKQFVASTAPFQRLGLHFDIHWKLSNRVLFRNTLPFTQCWEDRKAVTALGPDAFTLSLKDLLLHACIHRIAHGRGTERNRLIWLYDIHLLWHAMNEPEKQAFIEKALDKKIGALCADALTICEELFTPVGARLRAIVPPNRPQAGSHIDNLLQNKTKEPTARLINASKPRWALADLLAIDGIKNKVAFINEVLRK